MVPRPALRSALAVVLATSLALTTAPGAAAHDNRFRDGNDTPGALDLAQAAVGHDRGVVHTFTTHERWPAKLLKEDGFFVLGIDLNGDRDYELNAFVFYFRGGIRGILVRGRRLVAKLPASKTSSRSAKVEIPERYLLPGYWWAAFSIYAPDEGKCEKGCIDALPNRFPLIAHDLEAPTIKLESFPRISTTASNTTSFPVSFRVNDDGPGKLMWSLDRRAHGTQSWSSIETGRSEGDKIIRVDGREGATYEFRVRATDGQNSRVSPTRVVIVPYDDRNKLLTYDGPGGESDWSSDAVSGYFQGTRHESSIAGATIEFTFTGRYLAIYGGPTAGGTGRILVDGEQVDTFSEDSSTNKGQKIAERGWGAARERTITIEVTSGTILIDAIVATPASL